MEQLWNKAVEERFFTEARAFATPEQLFYTTDDERYLAYWPKTYRGEKNTLQSRNALIGRFTEKWTADLIQSVFGSSNNLFAVQGAICDELALHRSSNADVVISRCKEIQQQPEDILAIIEVKMSIVWNWELKQDNLFCIGDYMTHKGTPGLLRSDSMLKGIGKGINVRLSSPKANRIPYIVIGNTPIQTSYFSKVDELKAAGIIQGFLSVNPSPLDTDGVRNCKKTPKGGFLKMDSFDELKGYIESLLVTEMDFFSSMKSKADLGRIIEISNQQSSYEEKAQVFLRLIKE